MYRLLLYSFSFPAAARRVARSPTACLRALAARWRRRHSEASLSASVKVTDDSPSLPTPAQKNFRKGTTRPNARQKAVQSSAVRLDAARVGTMGQKPV